MQQQVHDIRCKTHTHTKSSATTGNKINIDRTDEKHKNKQLQQVFARVFMAKSSLLSPIACIIGKQLTVKMFKMVNCEMRSHTY